MLLKSRSENAPQELHREAAVLSTINDTFFPKVPTLKKWHARMPKDYRLTRQPALCDSRTRSRRVVDGTFSMNGVSLVSDSNVNLKHKHPKQSKEAYEWHGTGVEQGRELTLG